VSAPAIPPAPGPRAVPYRLRIDSRATRSIVLRRTTDSLPRMWEGMWLPRPGGPHPPVLVDARTDPRREAVAHPTRRCEVSETGEVAQVWELSWRT
jgi:hypothetical protein